MRTTARLTSVLLGLEHGEARKGLHEFLGETGEAEAVNEGLDLPQHSEDELVAHAELLMRHVEVDDDVEVVLVGLVEVADDVVQEEAVELSLDGQVLLDGAGDEGGSGADVLEGLEGARGCGLDVLGVSGEGKVDGVRSAVKDGNLLDVKGFREGENLLHLGRVLEREGRNEVSGGDDGTGVHVVGDGSRLGGLDGHDHLHRLDLNVGLSGDDLRTRLLEEPHDLSGDVGAELGGIEDGGHQDGNTVEGEAESEGLVHSHDTKRLASEVGDEATVRVLADLHLDVLPVDSEVHDVGGEAGDVKVVLGVEVRDLHGEGVHVVDVAEGGLALGEGLLDVGGDFVDVLKGPVDRRGRDNEVRGLGDTDALLLENSVKPRRVDGVLLELVRLEELNKVLDGGTDLSPDFDLLEGEDETVGGRSKATS